MLLGLVSGYFGGWLDRVLVVDRRRDLRLPVAAAGDRRWRSSICGGQSSLWGGILAAAISITVVFIPQYFRVIRAETVRIKAEAFVESAQGDRRVAHRASCSATCCATPPARCR